ncbi:hypothetical protein RIF29_13660 [Crotalaria pallida]|uniref:Uncharacterized protein n=1 Tax=Crotalaria pallida TaxID=3830 RepID=A0AAN9P380_CROPI
MRIYRHGANLTSKGTSVLAIHNYHIPCWGLVIVFSMGNLSVLQCAFVRFFVPLLLLVSFCYASSDLATTDVLGLFVVHHDIKSHIVIQKIQ